MAAHVPSLALQVRVASFRARWRDIRPRPWLLFLIGGIGLAIGAAVIGSQRAAQPLLTVASLIAATTIAIGVRIHRPARPWPWRLIAICTLLTSIGIGIVPAIGEIRHLGQALAGLGYAAGFGGFVLLIRARMPGGERSAFLDAAILAAGTGVLIWAFGFGPLAVAARQSSIATTAFFYPALIATAVVARMWSLAGAHRPATRLLVLLVISSLGIAILDMVRGFIGPDAFAGPYLFAEFASMALAGAAALHPSMAIGSERQHTGPEPVGPRRMVALVVALLVNPATLGIEVALGRAIDPAPYLIGGVVIGLLVIARLGDALRQLGDSLRERESLMELLRRQALYDALTSLPNRSLFDDRLAADFANRSPDRMLAVLLIDLDDFKSVNDSYGHEVGDALLAAVGQRLRGAVREGDTAARLGGDEFVIALPGCPDRSVALRVAERVIESLGQPYDIGGRTLTSRATVGVAIAGPDDRTAEEVVRNADVAMYLAKGRGKGRLELFEPSMQDSAMTQLQLRADLAVAIADGDLRLHYQPIVDLASGQTIGHEALVRWLRDGRLVPPGDFIPIAESSGLIGPLTNWVIAEACRTTASCGPVGDRSWVSVNLSSSQLLRQDLLAHLERTLEETGLAPSRLIVEITESSLVEIDLARPAIERLSRAGIRLAIDDFGTGYSALSYLARLPIDILKIDRSFVMALEQAGPEEAIAAAIIALAKRLGLTTIGEGIETAAQLEQLAALGCDLGQGFHLGRPAPRDLRTPEASHRIRAPKRTLAPVGA